MTVQQGNILIVEDNPDLAYGLRTGLEIEGYEVAVAEDGETGLSRAKQWLPDLVILDLMLPGMDGYRVLRSLRDDGLEMPVLILTARGQEADKVLGFRLGADDYVTKPCGVGHPRRRRLDRALRRHRDQPRVAHGDEGWPSSGAQPQGVRSFAHARAASWCGRVPCRAPS